MTENSRTVSTAGPRRTSPVVRARAGVCAVALLVWPGASVTSAVSAEVTATAAVVSSHSGTAWLVLPKPRRRLQLFDWLEQGSVVEVDAGSETVLVFPTGRRFSMKGRSRATLGVSGLENISGPVEALPPVPALPAIAPPAASVRVGRRTAAVRVRGLLGNLYPREGTALIATEAVLRFTAPAGSRTVEIEDPEGRRVFESTTESDAVPVKAEVLRPGTRYLWRVRYLDATGRTAREQETFVTLGEEQARAREELRRAAERDAALVPLLAEMDRRLGLLREAHDEMRIALDGDTQDPGLRAALVELERQLGRERGR